MEPRHYYDEFSRSYDREREDGYHALVDQLEAEIVLARGRGARVLEAGCGTGMVLRRVAPEARLAVGADLSHGMVGRAADRGLRVVAASILHLPFADGAFDVAYSLKVLAHVREIESALAELARVVRPGGVVLAEFYNPFSLRYLAKSLGGPGKIGERLTEAAVFTRWDPPWRIAEYLPPTLRIERLHGVRVFTPAAAFHRLPLVGRALARAERWATRTALPGPRVLGGFVIAELKRSD